MAITDGVNAAYTFNGDFTDATGNGNDGTASGAVIDINNQKFGSGCASFDQIDDRVEVDGLITQLANDTQGHLSFEVDLSVDNGANNTIFSVSKASGTRSEILCNLNMQGTGNKFLMQGRLDGVLQWSITTDDGSIAPNGYLNIQVAHDGVAPVVYFDTVLENITFTTSLDKTVWFKDIITDATNKADVATFGMLKINGGSRTPFGGFLDNCNLWNRVLTADERAKAESTEYPFAVELLITQPRKFMTLPSKRHLMNFDTNRRTMRAITKRKTFTA